MTHDALAEHQHDWNGAMKLTSVPRVRLYVEHPDGGSWFVNVGHVTERGRWRTGPHVHPDYGQVMFVRKGRGVMNLDGRRIAFEGPCALLVPMDCVHALDYENDVDRWVVTVERSYLTQINARLDEFITFWSQPRIIPLSHPAGEGEKLYSLIERLRQETGTDLIGQVAGIEALLTTLLLLLVRKVDLDQVSSEGAARSGVRLVDRFRKLVDQHYRAHLPLQEYASMLSVSLVQMRAACATAAEQSPTKMIHARLIAEAKRTLIFGDMTVEQIAFGLGFADAAYFTRFFRREVGETPSQFRVSARKQPQNTLLS